MRLSKLTAALVAAGLALPAFAASSDAATLQKAARAHGKTGSAQRRAGKGSQVAQDRKHRDRQGPRQPAPVRERAGTYGAPESDREGRPGNEEIVQGRRIAGRHQGDCRLATVVQGASGLPSDTPDSGTQLNYRADVTVELPLQPIGDIEHKLFGGFRMGQGQGLNTAFTDLGYYASAPNALAFRASGASPDDSVVILGQAYYQASIPIPFGGFKPYSRETLDITFGKMDIFSFFDQNAAAGDESRQFLNSVFVHNPLLDAGRRSRRRCQRLPARLHRLLRQQLRQDAAVEAVARRLRDRRAGFQLRGQPHPAAALRAGGNPAQAVRRPHRQLPALRLEPLVRRGFRLPDDRANDPAHRDRRLDRPARRRRHHRVRPLRQPDQGRIALQSGRRCRRRSSVAATGTAVATRSASASAGCKPAAATRAPTIRLERQRD